MAYDQIDTFMASIRLLESGSYDGNYGATGAYTGPLGRGLGAYQIMEGNWNSWSAEAGMPGANWRDPAAQDAVARFKMGQYYNQFGTWDLAAVAWFAGPGAAVQASNEGLASVGDWDDVLGTTVSDYVQRVTDSMGGWDGTNRNGRSWWDDNSTQPGRTFATMAPGTGAFVQLPGSSYPVPPGIEYPIYQVSPGYPTQPSYVPGSIRESLLNILDRFSNAVAGGARHPSGLASPLMVYGSGLEDGQPFYMPSEMFDAQTIASMTQVGPVPAVGPDGVPVMGAPPMGVGLASFPVPGYESALQNDWMEPREYRGGYHEGTDIVAPQGTPIVAPASGTIASIHTSTNGGNVVWLVDGEGRTHKFMHLLATASGVGVGTQVQAGQPIAFVGDTGYSSTPHLHYELHVGGAPVNPHEYLIGVSTGGAVGGAPLAAAMAPGGAVPPSASPEPTTVEGSIENLENRVRSGTPVIE